MKLIIIYNNYCYHADKIVNNLRNQILKIVYIDIFPHKILQKLYESNNLIIRIACIDDLKIKDGDYSIDSYTIHINNKRIKNIEHKLYTHNPIYKFIDLGIWNTHVNFKILYHNLLFYNKYILFISIILFLLSYNLFTMKPVSDAVNRMEILKKFNIK
jgi:hypothetical protein